MTLRGFTRPFAPRGTASLAPALPYDASMTGLLVHFRADPLALAQLLPRPLLPLNDPFSPRPEAGFLNIRPVGR